MKRTLHSMSEPSEETQEEQIDAETVKFYSYNDPDNILSVEEPPKLSTMHLVLYAIMYVGYLQAEEGQTVCLPRFAKIEDVHSFYMMLWDKHSNGDAAKMSLQACFELISNLNFRGSALPVRFVDIRYTRGNSVLVKPTSEFAALTHKQFLTPVKTEWSPMTALHYYVHYSFCRE